MIGNLPERLRQLARDCEDRARRSGNADAKALYWKAALDAERGARPSWEGDRLGLFMAISALCEAARLYDGEALPEVEIAPPVNPSVRQTTFCPAETAEKHILPSDRGSEIDPAARNARQLGEAFGLNERTARRAIERGVRLGWPGFYRHGRHWLALPDAFAQARGVSELCPNGLPPLQSGHDETDHTQAP